MLSTAAHGPTRGELRPAVFAYIELFDNARRRHSTLGMLSPTEFEKMTTMEKTKIN